MEDFLQQSGAYSYVAATILGFIFGLMSTFLVESIKMRNEKQRLIDLFVTDIYRNWRDVNETGAIASLPTKPEWGSVRFNLKGIGNLSIKGFPEFEFEVHNLGFYETEGFRLAQMLKTKARVLFWETYTLLRNAEAARLIVKDMPTDHEDYMSYKRLFGELVAQLDKSMLKLNDALINEKPWYSRYKV